ncbi:MAG: radical SAM protein [bacterium]
MASFSRRPRLRDFPHLVALRREAEERRELCADPDLSYLFWEATLRCNLRCPHCGSSCEPFARVEELTTGQVCDILDTIAEDFDARRITVAITGGEPLLRPDLCEVTAHMTGLGMEPGMVSNGTLLTPEIASRLYEAGMRTVSISVDGNVRTHDAIRGSGTYERALAGLTHARDAGFEIVEAITCVRPANLPVLSLVERAVRQAGAGLWRLITIDRMGRLADSPASDMWLNPAQVRHLLDFVEQRRAALKGAGDEFGVGFSCGGFLGLERERKVRSVYNQCHAGLCVGSILCDGQVSACPSMPRSWAQGSALETRFSTIWYERFERYRGEEWRREGICNHCSWYDVCLGGGLHERLAQPDEFCWLQRQED